MFSSTSQATGPEEPFFGCYCLSPGPAPRCESRPGCRWRGGEEGAPTPRTLDRVLNTEICERFENRREVGPG